MPFKTALFAASLAAASAHFLPAASEWTSNKINGIDVVAETGNLAPLSTPLPLTNFRYPLVDDASTVTFIADDPVRFNDDKNKPAAHGIYRYFADGRKLALVVSQKTPVGGRSAVVRWIRGLQSDGNRFAFHATTSDGADVIGVITGEEVEFVVDTKATLVSNTGRRMEYVNYPEIDGDFLLFSGAEENDEEGMYVLDISRKPYQPFRIASPKLPLPGKTDRFFVHFGSQNRLDGKKAFFLADFVKEPKSSFPVAGDKGSGGTRGLYMMDVTHPEFQAQPVTVIDGNTPVPFDPEHFFTFISSMIPVDGLTAIYGGWKGLNGIYLHDGKNMEVLADTDTEIAGLFEGSFTGFNKWVVNRPPMILFRGFAGKGFEGVFAYNRKEDKLYALCDNRMELEGKKISSFEISQHPLSGDSVALMIRFEDKSSGVFVAHFEKALSFSRKGKSVAALPPAAN